MDRDSDSDAEDFCDEQIKEQLRFGANDGVYIVAKPKTDDGIAGFAGMFEVQFSTVSYEGCVDSYLRAKGGGDTWATESCWVLEIEVSPGNAAGAQQVRLKTTLAVGPSAGIVLEDETQVVRQGSDLCFYQLKKTTHTHRDGAQTRIEHLVFCDCAWVLRRCPGSDCEFTVGLVFRGAKVFAVEMRPIMAKVGVLPRPTLPAPPDPPAPREAKKRARAA